MGNNNNTKPPVAEVVKALVGQATPGEIAEWKVANPDGIYFIKSDAGHIGYFREPMMADINVATESAVEGEPFASIRKFMELTFIGGSDAIYKDDKMFLGAKKEAAKHWGGTPASSGNL